MNDFRSKEIIRKGLIRPIWQVFWASLLVVMFSLPSSMRAETIYTTNSFNSLATIDYHIVTV